VEEAIKAVNKMARVKSSNKPYYSNEQIDTISETEDIETNSSLIETDTGRGQI